MNMDTKFQQVYSRNSTDWNFSVSENGRLTFVTSNGGIKQRCSLVLQTMKAYKTKKPILQKFIYAELKDKYTLADVVYALTKMEKINVVRKTRIGWALTAKGHRLIQASRLEA